MTIGLAIILLLVMLGLAVCLTVGRPMINPMDGKHDYLLYKMRGRPLACKECFSPFAFTEFQGVKQVYCPKKKLDSDSHEFFRWYVKDETEDWWGT